MIISNAVIDEEFKLSFTSKGIATVITIDVIHRKPVKLVVQLLTHKSIDMLVDAAAKKILGLSLRDKGVKDPLAVEDAVYRLIKSKAVTQFAA